jgi:hypothetical protein
LYLDRLELKNGGLNADENGNKVEAVDVTEGIQGSQILPLH